MIYFCCDQLRRNQLDGSALNGIDYLEVLDHEIELTDPTHRQKKLVVHFINDVAPNSLNVKNLQIEGGERIRGIVALSAALDGADAKTLNVDVDQYGDFSIYTLRLVQNAQNPAPPDGIDPLFAAVDFSFKVDCPTDFDCEKQCDCPPAVREEPEIDYLAKVTVTAGAKVAGVKELAALNGLTVPVRLTGPIDSPTYRLDFGALAAGLAKQQLQKQIGQQVDKALGNKGLGEALKGLLK